MSKSTLKDEHGYVLAPPRNAPQKWIEPEKADALRPLDVEELQKIRERGLVTIGTEMESNAIAAVNTIKKLMTSAQKEEVRLKAAERIIGFFDKPGPSVAVQINSRPQFHSHLGLPQAPPASIETRVVAETPAPPPAAEPRKDPVIPESWGPPVE